MSGTTLWETAGAQTALNEVCPPGQCTHTYGRPGTAVGGRSLLRTSGLQGLLTVIVMGLLSSATAWALDEGGSIVTWGDPDSNVPGKNNHFVAVAAGDYHNLGLRADGSIAAWGFCGAACDIDESLTGFVGIAGGDAHTLGLRSDGSIQIWGCCNFCGELKVPYPNADFVAVEAAGCTSFGLKADGSIVGWGDNNDWILYVPPFNTDFVALSVGGWIHALGLKADGSIVAWGSNDSGESDVPEPNTDFVAVAAGGNHSLGLKADGSIVCWGSNADSQCDVPAFNTDFVAVAAGFFHSFGLKSNGMVVAWGWNAFGQLDVPAPNENFVAIAGAGYHGLGIVVVCGDPDGDCNANGIPDGCDIAEGTSTDCNENGTPDECLGVCEDDCNHNLVPDSCDIAAGTSGDCNGDIVPDECQPQTDCNGNGSADSCDISVGTSDDCNANELPDECDLTGGTSADCNVDGVPDECDLVDCNLNGVPDDCDISEGVSQDCNGNGIPDECAGLFIDRIPITTTAEGVFSVFAADLDGDGDADVLSASQLDDKIAWYENTDGLGNFGPEQIVTTTANGALSVFAADLDGDGDIDILSASEYDDKIAWYENSDGLGSFGPEQIITTAANNAKSVFAADLDGDGDTDVLSASQLDDKIAWYENTDGLGSFGPQEIITTTANGAHSVFAADLDGDGDIDVLSASQYDHKIAWYENTDGLGSFGPEQIITTTANSARSVFAADLDGDGDTDVLSASQLDDKIAWYENSDGLGSFGPEQIITTTANGAHSVFAADLDGDGDIDVLSASKSDHKIAWYENTDGLGSFGPEQIITTAANGARSVFAADLDGDGNNDILSASYDDDKISWYANPHDADCNGNDIPDVCDIAEGTSSDCLGNGVPDECEPDCNANGVADSCDIADGESQDLNGNGIPDECEDCNGNEIPDSLDIGSGTSQDCNLNEVPDECDFANGTSEDCNLNEVPDECDIASGTSEDCNENELPDECDLTGGTSADCNLNEVPDECDVASGTSEDCNENELPDECDLTGGTSADCNLNGVPDDCELDCNSNGVPDSCDIAAGTSEDCSANGVPDECEPDCNSNGVADSCDIAAGTSGDCNLNEVPDECDVANDTSSDCNGNGIPDECDADENGTGVPDECETVHYVDADAGGNNEGTSWADAFISLQDALAAAAANDAFHTEVWVAGGVYFPADPGGDRSDTFALLNAVAVYGGFSGSEVTRAQRDPATNVTILSGDLNADDPTSDCCVANGSPGCEDEDCEESVCAVFPSCCDLEWDDVCAVIAASLCGECDGGNGDNSYHVVTGSGTDETAILDGFTVAAGNANGVDADGQGGGVYISLGSPTISNSVLAGNYGNAGGGMYTAGGSPTLFNCLFSGNSGGEGAGLRSSDGSPTLVNCTFGENHAVNLGGGIYAALGALGVTNCILWGNTSELDPTVETSQIHIFGGSPVVSYSCIEGLDTLVGNGNIGSDPLFVGPGVDYHLSPGSPCIDAADNDAVPLDTSDLDGDADTSEPASLDLDGNPRFVDDPATEDTGNPGVPGPPVVDMGVYEFQAEEEPCEGDANGDGTVDPLDSGFVLARFGCPVGTGDPNCDIADQNGDGLVDSLDVGFILARFGDCP